MAESREQQEAARLRRSSLPLRNLQPMMVNLNEDKTLAGRVRFCFSEGRNLIGGLGRWHVWMFAFYDLRLEV